MSLERLAEARDSRAPVDFEGNTAEPAVKSGKPRVFKPLHVTVKPPVKHRVRIVKAGWQTFTGQFAGHRFVDAVSVEKLPQVTIDRIAALTQIVDEKDEPVGVIVRDDAAKEVEAPVIAPLQTLEAVLAAAEPIIDGARVIYPHDTLLAIADKKGISGLREISDPLGVKGRAIPDLIQAILQAQDQIALNPEG